MRTLVSVLAESYTLLKSALATNTERVFMFTFFRILFGCFLTFFLSSSRMVPPAGNTLQNDSQQKEKYVWTQLTPAAGFSKSYNFQLFSDGQHMWAFHSEGMWSSVNGKVWTKTELTNILNNNAFLDYVKFKGAIYALGTFEGNIEHHSQTSQIARTTDFKRWEILAKNSSLPKRFFYHPFVFQNKIWIIGGEDDAGTYADAWTSPDAIHWTSVADNLPFGKRAGQQFIVFNNTIYMLSDDVWVSSNGLNWSQLTPKIADGDIFGYSPEVFENEIWLIACNRSGKFRSEVLHSSDGMTWIPERAPWTPRGGVATCIFKNQIIMTGGKYGGPGIAGQTEFVYSNDVWSFGKK